MKTESDASISSLVGRFSSFYFVNERMYVTFTFLGTPGAEEVEEELDTASSSYLMASFF